MDLSNTTWAQRGLINKLPGNTVGIVARVRPIIITFGIKNVVHNGLTFGAGIDNRLPRFSITFGIGNRVQNIELHLVPYPNDITTYFKQFSLP